MKGKLYVTLPKKLEQKKILKIDARANQVPRSLMNSKLIGRISTYMDSVGLNAENSPS